MILDFVLSSLATGTSSVQQKLAAYGDELVSLGVDGVRLDAAKSASIRLWLLSKLFADLSFVFLVIPSDDIKAILALMKKPPSYVSQEVVFGEGEEIQPSEYVQNGALPISKLPKSPSHEIDLSFGRIIGKVHEFRYAVALQNAFLTGTINNLTDLDQRGLFSVTLHVLRG